MASEEKGDHLCLAGNHSVQKMLNKHGKNTPLPEIVKFSDFVIKINRREKEQTRVMLITNKAVYNLMPNNYGKCKRRIAIDELGSVTASQVSDEFVLHVPAEYDYRFKSAKKDTICKVLQDLFKKYIQKHDKNKKKRLNVTFIQQSDLKDRALTKAMARLQTREDILQRSKALAAEAHDSDAEDTTTDEKKDKITQLLDSTEKVRLDDFELLKSPGPW